MDLIGSKINVYNEGQEELCSAVSDYSESSSFEGSQQEGEGIIIKYVNTTSAAAAAFETVAERPAAKMAHDNIQEESPWKDLPRIVQDAATRLRYKEQIWSHSSQEEDFSNKCREELDPEEKEASKVLGNDEVHWDFMDKQVKPIDHDAMYWNQLPKHIRKAYRVLGYRKHSWNQDNDPPACFDKDWFELTEAEQKAATIIGYTSTAWDENDLNYVQEKEDIIQKAIYFARGSCHVLLDCISMSAFADVIKAFFSLSGRRFLNKNVLAALKIVVGLAIFTGSGQTHIWLEDDEEEPTSRNGSGKSGTQPSLFRSFLNLFSWWTIFVGVDHFVEAFEEDVLYNYVNTPWYLNLCGIEPKNATTPLHFMDAFETDVLHKYSIVLDHQGSRGKIYNEKEEHEELSSAASEHSEESSFQSSHPPPREEEGITLIKFSVNSSTSSTGSVDTATEHPAPVMAIRYEECAWEDLPFNVQEAATRLGYTEQIWSQENSEDPNKKYWEELDQEEKVAAKVLGYDEVHWDFGDKVVTPADYEDMYWNQLPKPIRKAYRVLGYRRRAWNEDDDDDSPASFDKDWFELTDAEQKAATIVGYTAETWDEDPNDIEEVGIREGSINFVKGSCYVLLDCLSMSAFFGIVKVIFSLGERYLDDNVLASLKIVVGLAIMALNGQTRRWLDDEEEEANGRGGRKGKQPTLFRSFLNLLSWWTIFAGVEHFADAFEEDVLYAYAESPWYLKLCEEEAVLPANTTTITVMDPFENDVLFSCAASNVTTPLQSMTAATVNSSLSFLKQRLLNYTDMLGDFVIDSTCEILDDDQERLGPVYYWTLFITSAISMWYAFDDNFVMSCDVD
ncbi:MAG: hypothetical protein SGBAC_003159 [Bacillariaceae sp.]